MGPIPLTSLDLALASVLVIVVAASSYYGRLAISKPLLVGGVRTAGQLILIGLCRGVFIVSTHICDLRRFPCVAVWDISEPARASAWA